MEGIESLPQKRNKNNLSRKRKIKKPLQISSLAKKTNFSLENARNFNLCLAKRCIEEIGRPKSRRFTGEIPLLYGRRIVGYARVVPHTNKTKCAILVAFKDCGFPWSVGVKQTDVLLGHTGLRGKFTANAWRCFTRKNRRQTDTLQEQIRFAIRKLSLERPEAKKIVLTGHRKWANLAILAGIDHMFVAPKEVLVYTFGAPKCCDDEFNESMAEICEKIPDKIHIFRVRNREDIAVHQPLSSNMGLDFQHLGVAGKENKNMKSVVFSKNFGALGKNSSLDSYYAGLKSDDFRVK